MSPRAAAFVGARFGVALKLPQESLLKFDLDAVVSNAGSGLRCCHRSFLVNLGEVGADTLILLKEEIVDVAFLPDLSVSCELSLAEV